jgi:hypothetical protein
MIFVLSENNRTKLVSVLKIIKFGNDIFFKMTFFLLIGIKPRIWILDLLGKCFTTDLYP